MRYVLALLVGALLLPAPASGGFARFAGYPGEREITKPHPDMARSLSIAEQFWAARGLEHPARSRIHVVAGLGHAATAEPGGDRIWFDRDTLARMLSPSTTDPVARRLLRRHLCGLAIHELGHNLNVAAGFPGGHAPSGVMHATMEDGDAIPFECRKAYRLPRSSR